MHVGTGTQGLRSRQESRGPWPERRLLSERAAQELRGQGVDDPVYRGYRVRAVVSSDHPESIA